MSQPSLLKKELTDAEANRFGEEKLFLADLAEPGLGIYRDYAVHHKDTPFVKEASVEYLLFSGVSVGLYLGIPKADMLLFVEGMYDQLFAAHKLMDEGGMQSVIKNLFGDKPADKKPTIN